MNLVSLFSGCGGLDLGFERAGFQIVFANEYDKEIWRTYELNHPQTYLDKRNIKDIQSNEIPDCVGIIGGPPCQSWSEAGARRGMNDPRGALFFEFIRILKEKQPSFFLAENVSGILAPCHRAALDFILASFADAGYRVTFRLLNANYYDVPEDRKRVIVVGYRKDLNRVYCYPQQQKSAPTLRAAIIDLAGNALPAGEGNRANEHCPIPNHEYWIGGFSTIYLSRNRVRSWDEPSFTIQAGGRHAPLHPQSPKMLLVGKNRRIFDPDSPMPYRRLSVRECARIQTFPDDFIFYYNNVSSGYKMIGNAVPVNFAYHLARQIYADLCAPLQKESTESHFLPAYSQQLNLFADANQ